MRRYKPAELAAFLRQVDKHMKKKCRLVLIGGAALALGYSGTHATADFDLWDSGDAGFWRAVEVARAKAKKSVPIQRASIAEPPYDFEERLRPLKIRGLKKLQIFIPEAHDLALLKTSRAEAHDLDAIEDIHRHTPLDLDTLIARYHETKGQVMGPESRFRLNFMTVVARLFGQKKAEAVEPALRERK